MLWTNIRRFDADDYKKLQTVIQFLQTHDWSATPLGRLEVNEDFYAQVLSYDTEPIDSIEFEVHHHRLDIHFLVSGEEEIDVGVDEPIETRYLTERDLAYVQTPARFNRIHLKAGDALIIGMNEAHRTNGISGKLPVPVKKVVLKLKH